MSQLEHTVRVDVGEDSDDLLEALSIRGFEARLLASGEIEVAPPPGEEELWNLEIITALEAWLEGTDRTSILARSGEHTYTVRVPEWTEPAEAPPREPEPEPPPAAAEIELDLEVRPEPDEAPELEEAETQRRRLDPALVAAGIGAFLLLAAGIWLVLAAVLQVV